MAFHVPWSISMVFVLLVLGLLALTVVAVSEDDLALGLVGSEGRRRVLIADVAITVWLMITGGLALSGFFLEFQSVPPRFFILLLVPLFAIGFLLRTRFADDLVAALSPVWFIVPQGFRIIMELILWLLFINGIMPEQVTFEGRNFDILVGLTAPVVAWLCFVRRALPPSVAVAWNVLGLLLLANVVITAILSAPTPFRVFMNEPAVTVIAYLPFVWLPAFVVPMAVLLHALSLKQLLTVKAAR